MEHGVPTFVFASFNEGKFREVALLLEGLPVRLVTPRDVGVETMPEETGETFLDNALLKAAWVYRPGLWVLADDSGLKVAALGGAPGVYSRHYAGVGCDDRANIARLLRDLSGVSDRRACFVCYAVLLGPVVAEAFGRVNVEGVMAISSHPFLPCGTAALVAVGEVWGWILEEPVGENGFGYDPVFFREDLGRTFAQLTRDEKNALSHRGQAFRRLRQFVEVFLGLSGHGGGSS